MIGPAVPGAHGWPVRVGSRVRVDDPLGYAGAGVVVAVETSPYHVVSVTMDDTGRDVWVLAPHVGPP